MAQEEMPSARGKRDADPTCTTCPADSPNITTSAINPAAEPNSIPHHSRPHLIWIDFDQTLTADDSIAYLAALPTASSAQLAAAAPAVPWSALVDAYLADYDACLRSHPANSTTEAVAKSRRDCAIHAVCSRIIQLRPAEAQSVARLEKARYFAGLDPRDVRAHGAEVVLHPGVREVLARWVAMGREVAICSVNWSVDLIRGALEVDRLQVVCNDLEVVSGRTTGRILGGVLDGTDKLRRFEERLVGKEVEDGVAVFIGDSLNDVPCMLRADIGILFAPAYPIKSSLLKLFDECGITLIDLATTTCSVDRAMHLADAPCRLYRARSWAEIDRFLARA
ncbi:hypothetical protein AMAG_16595 [Allomyces macrogynus ATCC 38327]|uniref:Uncharacterized protein n=1 Tax=Allomyces macrogynus (strain ATCC 38327) TaxID=578462 RepID=A0A0L0TC26_ALLM3|nr:hypothetical protein AMAG_16595 [Allomyces macrogynus ATCC 38327]|eukprot:KNE72099.1 hypothetical protein AMAG_16595 [Allomyces macrogynus ATCC 38327]